MTRERILIYALAVPAGVVLGVVAALVECDHAYRHAHRVPSTHTKGMAYGIPPLSAAERLQLAATLGRVTSPRATRGGP